MNTIIRARGIRKTFGTLEVLRSIDLEIYGGEIVSIVGPSGAGKSTLLQILGTLTAPEPGASLMIGDIEVVGLSERARAELRNRRLGFVFQSHQLLPEFTALENVLVPQLISGGSRRVAESRARELLGQLGLTHRLKHRPSELSGGECQRVAVARALMNSPEVILADEPSGSLDTASKEDLHNLFFDLRSQLGQTFVIVTHDTALAERADRMITITDGRISQIV